VLGSPNYSTGTHDTPQSWLSAASSRCSERLPIWQHSSRSEHKEHVIEVLHWLLANWHAGAPIRWENVTIPNYVEAMAAWLEGFEQVYVNTGRQVPADG